jgi:hypothetical protein
VQEAFDRTLLYLRLESFISARWGVGATLRPRATSHSIPDHIEPPTTFPLSDYVWIAFADDRSPRAVGMRFKSRPAVAPRYEILEHTRAGEVLLSVWRFERNGGWTRITA